MNIPDNADLFDRYDREQERRAAELPICADCGCTVYDHYYLINDEVICPECMESNYRKEVDEW